MPSLVENGQVVLEKKIFKFVNVFSLFRNYLPFGEEMTYLIPLDPRMHCVPSLVENGQVVLEKKSKIGKVYRQMDGRTTGYRKSSLELSAFLYGLHSHKYYLRVRVSVCFCL